MPSFTYDGEFEEAGDCREGVEDLQESRIREGIHLQKRSRDVKSWCVRKTMKRSSRTVNGHGKRVRRSRVLALQWFKSGFLSLLFKKMNCKLKIE
mmetsp:Transcript_5507/g.14398  ORF Transcript_5507/g.14398 Transcript_5507/m.14398 type:complete len:95 (+) Transcript_5507:127-411(+)